MEPDQSGGQMDVGLNAEMTRVTEESAGGSGSNQMAMLQMQLRITEMELAMERLRNENGARAAAAVQNAEADRSEDRRLRYTSLLKDVLVPMPTPESLVPSWFDDVEATFDCYDVPAGILEKFVIEGLRMDALKDGYTHKDFRQQIAEDLSHVAESLIKRGALLCSCRGRTHLDEREAKFVQAILEVL
ncbi:hypothetical protein HPB50_000104 [Hyalomma asiaticum]|uniref:Uncharacterized protein n=1 Tax=Hyalomma asiaticum TaxID=266040 RepID=A0ACB7SW96_HYAAI|nr:hypothetical protein HPB50_000104 [Hyalomma asiaticum]